jgi:SAM-dependent methyltransferase
VKFREADQRYFARREAFAKEIGAPDLWRTMDHWPLYVGLANLGRSLAVADLLRGTLDVPGDVAEFGCWRGANTMLMAKLLRLWDPMGPKVVHAFESFEGLQAFSDEDGAAVEQAGRYRGSREEFEAAISLYELGDEIALHAGRIDETLPAVLEATPSLSFSFVYCDTDLYESTQAIVRHLHPRLSKGGVFVFDEWNYESFAGETLAVREFLKDLADAYEMEGVRGARQPSLVLRKTKA